MRPDRVSNPGLPALESDAPPTALRGRAKVLSKMCACARACVCVCHVHDFV